MTWLTRWGFKNKAAVSVVVVLALALGLFSYFTLPMELLPSADNPQITIATLGQGYDSKTMVDEVTEPIENAVASVKGKVNIFSTTGDGYSKVDMTFDSKTNMKDAKSAVQDALNTLKLPEGVSKPNIVQLNTDMIPIAEIALTFDGGLTKANMDKASKTILPKFQSIKGVGNVALYGKTDPRVVVQLDKKKMAQYHVPLQTVMGLLQGQNMAVSIGEQSINGKQANLKVMGNINSLDRLRQLPIQLPMPNAPDITLGDIASVKKVSDQTSITRVNGKETLELVITKNSSSSAVTVGKAVTKEANKLNNAKDGVKANVLMSTADLVVNSVNSMMREVLMGALFATIVIVLFLRNLRSTMITIVSIPLSLGITLFLLWKSGITLNILTLGGVAVAVGRLVDDSIVVIENIFRKTQLNSFTKETVFEGTKEVATAITSSTLTTVAVFLPMGLLQGSLRSFLLPFALTITYSLLASLVVALTVVPLMSAGLLKKAKLPSHKQPRRYMKLLRWSLNHKLIPIILAVLFFFGSIGLYYMMPKGAINSKDSSMVQVQLTYPSDTPVKDVKGNALSFEKKLDQLKGNKYVITQVGNNSDAAKWGQVSNPSEATFTIILKDGADSKAYIDHVKTLKKDFPNADLSVTTTSMMGSSSSEITLDLIGNNEQDLVTASNKVMASIKGLSNVNKVTSNQQETKPVYSIKVNAEKANTQQVAMQLRALLNQTPIGSIKLNGTDTTVYLNSDVKPTSKDDINKLQVNTQAGPVPVSKIASITKSEQSSVILHKDGKQYIRVSVLVNPDKLSVVAAKVQQKTKDLKLPKGVKLVTGGASTQQASDFTDLGLTMLASIGLVYLIMVVTFKNLRTPIAILMTLPLASIGAILGLLISKVSIDPTALFGALMLIGIVVTNAIVLIDRVRQNEEKNMIIREAIIDAASTRLRPILMTATATIFAMLPLLLSHNEAGSLISKGLAVVVIGGLTVATALTLIIVPVFYELLYFRKSKKQRRAAKES